MRPFPITNDISASFPLFTPVFEKRGPRAGAQAFANHWRSAAKARYQDPAVQDICLGAALAMGKAAFGWSFGIEAERAMEQQLQLLSEPLLNAGRFALAA
jgi:hypothetical protein